jgi:hypothetical protein
MTFMLEGLDKRVSGVRIASELAPQEVEPKGVFDYMQSTNPQILHIQRFVIREGP